MKVLVLGRDPHLFAPDGAYGDALDRHRLYVRALRRRHPGSEIRLVSFGPRDWTRSGRDVDPGLRLYSTRSIDRMTFRVGLLRILRHVLDQGWRPDVVTTQTPWEEGTIGWMVARVSGAAFLPQVHFDISSKAWLSESWANTIRQRVAWALLRRADRVRAVSSDVRDRLVGRGVPPVRIWVVPVGSMILHVTGSKDEWKRRLSSSLAGRPIVLFVGRFVEQKNLPLWIEVAHRVRRRVPKVFFVLAGGGPLLEEVRGEVIARGLEDSCWFTGPVTADRLGQLYAAADVLLLTSEYEGFGRVIIEAWQAGVPVVATRTTGPSELIEPEVNGLLTSTGDANGLTDAVVRLLEEGDLRRRMGDHGRRMAEARFSAEVLAERVVDFWEGRR